MRRLQECSVGSSAERELLEQCRDTVRKLAPGAEVILYGSRARGDAGPESDYDLLILVDRPVDWQLEDRIRRHLYHLELESGAVLTVNAYSRADWSSPLYHAMPFHRNVEQDGIVL
jgi:predicted nucleotidyltransferase